MWEQHPDRQADTQYIQKELKYYIEDDFKGPFSSLSLSLSLSLFISLGLSLSLYISL